MRDAILAIARGTPWWALWILAGNLGAGCYLAIAYLPQMDFDRQLQSPIVRVLVLLGCAWLGMPLLVAVACGSALQQRGLHHPPMPRRRGS